MTSPLGHCLTRLKHHWLFPVLLVLPELASAQCGAPATPIADVQGTSDASALVGQQVTVEGILTLDARQQNGFGGFYLQQSDAETDGDDRTSEALFVYTRRGEGQVGSRLRLTGRVKEFHGLTELTRLSSLEDCGPDRLPEPVMIDLPWSHPAAPESLENMRVTVKSPLTLIDAYGYARFGELTLARTLQTIPTQVLPPGDRAQQLFKHQAANRITLDDGQAARNPRPLPWPAKQLKNDRPIRIGDQLDQLTGILDFRFGEWRLQPTATPRFLPQLARPTAPPDPNADTLRVANLNLGNLFNGDGNGQGFPTSRGARSQQLYQRQLDRMVSALAALKADIIAVAEIENDGFGPDSSIAQLANALGDTWQFVATPGLAGNDAIRTDLLYRADRVEAIGQPERLNQGAFQNAGRPPIAQMFRPRFGDQPKTLRVVSAHLKSKSCAGAGGADRDLNDGQGCYNTRRMASARAIVEWLKVLNSPDGFAGTLITGDLNSYPEESPIKALTTSGYTDLLAAPYSCNLTDCPQTTFRFKGRQGRLDYSLASAALLSRIAHASVWAINAEEFPALGYDGPLATAVSGPWRVSDHNPVLTDVVLSQP